MNVLIDEYSQELKKFYEFLRTLRIMTKLDEYILIKTLDGNLYLKKVS